LIFTDGRANVSLAKGDTGATRSDLIRSEMGELGAALQREGITPVIIDTRLRFASNGEGQSLADLLGGSYVYLPRADANAVYNAVRREASVLREEAYSRSNQ
jgi:Mg-chelatase subunit ChlD